MIDAANEIKGTTDNEGESDDPDSGNYQHSNEKRKGRFLIKEIEEENLIQNKLHISEDLINNDFRPYSFHYKKYNFTFNTIEYFGEVLENDTPDTRNIMTSYIFDNKTDSFVPSQKILNKIKNPKFMYNYVDLYLHVNCHDDCTECYNYFQFNCDREIEDVKDLIALDDNKSYQEKENNNSKLNQENCKTALDNIIINDITQDKPKAIQPTDIKISKTIEEEFGENKKDVIIRESEKLSNFPICNKRKSSMNKFNSNNSLGKEYQFLSAYNKKESLNSPQSCKFHSGKIFKNKTWRRFYSTDINFSLMNLKYMKEEKNLENFFSAKLAPISKIKDSKTCKPQNKMNSMSSMTCPSAASSRFSKVNRNPSKIKFQSINNVGFKISNKKFLFSKRHYSADYPYALKEEKNKNENYMVKYEKNMPSVIVHNEYFELSSQINSVGSRKILDETENSFKIENSSSLSFYQAEKLCARCNIK